MLRYLADKLRWRILALLFLATVINFVDRQTLSVVAPVLRDEFKFSNQQYGLIVACFQLGMMLAEFPMGMLMDRWGVRRGFSFAVIWWSIASAMHGLANSVTQFGLLRFWLGTGECGNFSGSTKVVGEWFPPKERALAVGIFNGGTMVGSILAPPLVVWLVHLYGWRVAFVVPSALGLVWVLLWLKTYRPNAESFGAAGKPPTNRELLRLRQTWACILARTLGGPVMHLYVYWLPEYLYRQRGFSLKDIGLFAWVPFLFADVGSILGGWFSGWLIARGYGLHDARKISIALSTLLTAASIGVAIVESIPVAFALICTAMFGFMWMSATLFAVFSDLFPENAVGRVTGLTGVGNGASSMILNFATGYVVDRFSYVPVFAMAGLLPALGMGLLFLLAGRIERVKIKAPHAGS
ncbi:MAG TPA: MFS transporter [Bryobacteraceae bacterium]|jgi:MFS transporter, ACS family, aldohexuronate transporter|nr:MFS transporter [Bryobacteraceae bacterium]